MTPKILAVLALFSRARYHMQPSRVGKPFSQRHAVGLCKCPVMACSHVGDRSRAEALEKMPDARNPKKLLQKTRCPLRLAFNPDKRATAAECLQLRRLQLLTCLPPSQSITSKSMKSCTCLTTSPSRKHP